jgi:hypothetical protein
MKKIICSAISCLLLTGCVTYSSYIQIGNTKFRLPKDSKFDVLTAQVPIILTNGADGKQLVAYATLSITNGTFKMNPEVIDKTTQHDVAIVNAVGTLIIDAGAKAAATFVK